MRGLILINAAILVAIVIAAGFIMNDEFGLLMVFGIVAAIIISGGLTACFYYKRGQVYEKRGESGPDG